MLRRLVILALIGLSGCTQGGPEAVAEEPPPPPAGDPDPATAEDPAHCELRYGADPYLPPRSAVKARDLREVAAWSRVADARGGYAHRVDFDGEGKLTWGHDSGSMDFSVTRFDAEGELVWHHEREPKEHEPGVVTTTRSGVSLVAGTAFGSDYTQLVVALDASGEPMWSRPTPRLGVDRLAPATGGLTIFEGHSGRREVMLGEYMMVSDWGSVQGMDVVGALDRGGEVVWTRNFLPGILDMAVREHDIFVVGNYGDFEVDFGTGPALGPGVVARLDAATGEHRWSRRFDTGLKAIVPQGEDVLVVGFPGVTSSVSMGGPPLDASPAAWLDADGCYRGSVALGDIGHVDAGEDGSLVAYGLLEGEYALGTHRFDRPVRGWVVARFDARLSLTHVIEADCENVSAAAGPDGRLAISCYRDLSSGAGLARRYELFLVE